MNWVSVEDRLPKNGIYVLVVWFGRVQYAAAKIEQLNDLEFEWVFSSGEVMSLSTSTGALITHWMPLPEPPVGSK